MAIKQQLIILSESMSTTSMKDWKNMKKVK